MSCDERVEGLLNRAHATISDLPVGENIVLLCDDGHGTAYLRHALECCGLPVEGEQGITTVGDIIVGSCAYGLRLCEIIERLCTALEDTLGKYDKALYRLRSWGDIQYAASLEEEKI